MKKTMTALVNPCLTFILPVSIWCFITPLLTGTSRYNFALNIAIALFLFSLSLWGVFRATVGWPLIVRLFLGGIILAILFFLFAIWSFAVELTGATTMP